MKTASKRSTPASHIAIWGWPLVAARIAALLALVVICVPLHYAVAPFTSAKPVPRLFLRLVGTVAGLRVRSSGPQPAPRTFFLANHVSWLDIPAIAGLTGCAFVAHDGLASIGPLRWLCRLNDTVFVARHDRRSVARQVEQVREALCETGALAIFPEGTTATGTRLLPFKSSLLSAIDADAEHVPVQPIWLDYGRHVGDIAWVNDEPGLANALRILARWRPIPLTIHFLAPLEGADRADRKAMARTAREQIEAAMQRG
ncbi:1-acyl-sn-glycerol-3-phosphate acyltransferase [Novosphingobium endophyticum]|uniref:1-acyl-sn-glycerol-3-phosphate acyltransferase n=1 Tax=Novosphingobium endophyticum TaxID=1955250 RepID=A0A916X412_9SPHN|nr:lysophospholipid acyltransferase family protein [Novosphingobium endophyticum]GGB97497.1 1-acyl-sn-glycerol-3-phosphate acyltransferase [Novosphingobium endophyticum]